MNGQDIAIPHTVQHGPAGLLAETTAALSAGPSRKAGLEISIIPSGLHVEIQDQRQYSMDLAFIFTHHESTDKPWTWKAGEAKIFDFTLTFNREVDIRNIPTEESLAALKEQIDGVINPVVAEGWIPGLTVGIIHNDEQAVWGYGTTSLKTNRVPDGSTVYEIASITKLFTKLLFSDIVHRGKMGLDDKVQPYLPGGVKMPVKENKEITLLMLSNHTSGLPMFPENSHQAYKFSIKHHIKMIYHFLSNYQLEDVPGEKFQYSNLGVGLLSYLVARKNGTTWIEYIRERILKPLGMHDTGMIWTTAQRMRAAQGYDSELQPLVQFMKWNRIDLHPAVALHSTVNDLLKLAGAGLDQEKSALSDIAFDEIASKLDWGNYVSHAGGINGFNTVFAINRELKNAVIVLGNSDSCNISQQIAWQIKNILEKKFITGINLPGMNFAPLRELSVIELKHYTGQYLVIKAPAGWSFGLNKKISFYLKGRTLCGRYKQMRYMKIMRFYPLDNGDFFTRSLGLTITFTKDGEGRVTGFTSKELPDLFVAKT